MPAAMVVLARGHAISMARPELEPVVSEMVLAWWYPSLSKQTARTPRNCEGAGLAGGSARRRLAGALGGQRGRFPAADMAHYTPGRPGHRHVYIEAPLVYTDLVAKHLIDIDERALDMARAELGTTTIKETVNAALRLATSHRAQRVAAALDLLAAAPSDDRAAAWR